MKNVYQSISSKQVLNWFIVRTIFLIVLAATIFIAHYFLKNVQIDEIPREFILILNILSIIMLVITGIYSFIMPFLQKKYWKYRICDDKIEIYHGVITKVIHVLPVARIQQITVLRSISNRIFGLSNIIVETSGNQQKIIGIEKEKAESLVLMLNERVNIIVKADSEVDNL